MSSTSSVCQSSACNSFRCFAVYYAGRRPDGLFCSAEARSWWRYGGASFRMRLKPAPP